MGRKVQKPPTKWPFHLFVAHIFKKILTSKMKRHPRVKMQTSSFFGLPGIFAPLYSHNKMSNSNPLPIIISVKLPKLGHYRNIFSSISQTTCKAKFPWVIRLGAPAIIGYFSVCWGPHAYDTTPLFATIQFFIVFQNKTCSSLTIIFLAIRVLVTTCTSIVYW